MQICYQNYSFKVKYLSLPRNRNVFDELLMQFVIISDELFNL